MPNVPFTMALIDLYILLYIVGLKRNMILQRINFRMILDKFFELSLLFLQIPRHLVVDVLEHL